MASEYARSARKKGGVLLRMMLLTGFLLCLRWAAAMGDEGTKDAIPPEYAGKMMPAGMRDNPKASLAGKDIYDGTVNPEVNCARCHGSDGKPTKLGKGAHDLSDPTEGQKHSDAEWFWRLSEKSPGSKMPSFRDKLSEEQRWQVIAYLRTLTQSGK